MKFTSLPIFTALVGTSSGAIILDTEDRLLGNLFFLPDENILAPNDLDFDINRDGQIDFTLIKRVSLSSEGMGLVETSGNTRFVSSPNFVASLEKDFQVGPALGGPAANFRIASGTEILGAIVDNVPFGEFFGDKTSYLGFEFQAETGTHYGYAEITAQGASGMIIESVAWESTPGESILTGAIPEPSSSLLLGLAVAASVMRRKRNHGHPEI
jgi:hypothetical protein